MMTSHKKCPPLGHITHFCGEVRGVLLVLLYAFIAICLYCIFATLNYKKLCKDFFEQGYT